MRILASALGLFIPLVIFLMENDLGEVSSAACANYSRITGFSTCPEWVSNPAWREIFIGIAIILIIVGLWPVLGWLLSALLRLYGAVGRTFSDGVNALKRRLRIFAVNAIEEATGRPVFVDKEHALRIIRQSRLARAAHRRAQEPKSFIHGIIADPIHRFYDNPEQEVFNLEYSSWIELVLDRYVKENVDFNNDPDDKYYRQKEDGTFEYSEKMLQQWLEKKWKSKVLEKFGDL